MKPKRNRTRRGWSLTELLVVAVLVSLLSAAAVPNLLLAHTRARVATVLNGMRVMAGAIEAYTVDFGMPFPRADYRPPGGGGWSQGGGVMALTTPVAYISTLPRDPFGEQVRFEFYSSSQRFWAQEYPLYRPNSPTLLDWDTSGGYDYYAGAGTTRRGVFYPFFPPPLDQQYTWCLASPGPDLMWYEPNPDHSWWYAVDYDRPVIYYDATNGTRSGGNLYMYGPGACIMPIPQPRLAGAVQGYGPESSSLPGAGVNSQYPAEDDDSESNP